MEPCEQWQGTAYPGQIAEYPDPVNPPATTTLPLDLPWTYEVTAAHPTPDGVTLDARVLLAGVELVRTTVVLPGLTVPGDWRTAPYGARVRGEVSAALARHLAAVLRDASVHR